MMDGGPLRALVGANYSKTKDIDSNGSEVAPVNSLVQPDPSSFFPIGPGLAFPSNFFQRNTYLQRDEDIMSVYAFIAYKPTPELEITAEGRYTYEDQNIIDFLVRQAAPNTGLQTLTPPNLQRNTSFVTPRGSITWKPTDNNMIYASVARGVKSGGAQRQRAVRAATDLWQ